jgi:hypothetical protein
MAKQTECTLSCCDDVVTNTFGKVGVNRSMMITLALIPFAWDGVVWVGQAVNSLWGLVTNAVG